MTTRKSKSNKAEPAIARVETAKKTTVSAWAVCLGLALLTFAIFSPVLKFDFVNFDDPEYVTREFHVQKGLLWENVKWAFTSIHANFWHPLTTLSHMLDCQLFELNASGHHLTNLLLHIASTVVLFLFLNRITSATWRSAIVAALFAWHPLHVESVAWIAERKDVLSTFFWMLTLWFYALYAEKRTALRYSATLISFVLGLLAKPMLVTLPFVLLLLDYWPLGRVFSNQRSVFSSQKPPAENWKLNTEYFPKLLLEKLPFFILSAIAIIVTLAAEKHGGAVMTSEQLPFFLRTENAVISYLAYLQKTFWPANLAVFYPYQKGISLGAVGLAAIVLVFITAMIFKARRFSFLTVGWLWFLGTLVPVIGLVQVGSHAMADRYTYVPLVGLFIALVWGIGELASHKLIPKMVLNAFTALTLLCCAAFTSTQLKHWKNSETLFEHALAVTKNNAVAHVQLAAFAVTKSDWTKAQLHADAALKLFPDSAIAHHVRGLIFEAQGDWPNTALHFTKAVEAKPNYAEALFGLGKALSHLGQNEEAIRRYTEAIQLNPNDPFPRNNLGNLLLQEGRIDEAIAQYSEALRLKPDYEDARFNLDLARQQSK